MCSFFKVIYAPAPLFPITSTPAPVRRASTMSQTVISVTPWKSREDRSPANMALPMLAMNFRGLNISPLSAHPRTAAMIAPKTVTRIRRIWAVSSVMSYH